MSYCTLYIYMYVYAHPPTRTYLFFLFYWLDFIARSIIPYTVYIYTHIIYIYTRPKFGDILWPFLCRTIFWQGGCTPSMTRLGGSWAPGGPCVRLKMGDWPVKHVDFQLQNIGLQWNVHDDDKNIEGFMPKSGFVLCFDHDTWWFSQPRIETWPPTMWCLLDY